MKQKRLSIPELMQRISPSGLVPPQCIETEESLLGAMMIDKNSAAQAIEILGMRTTEDTPFYRGTHTLVYLAAIALDSRSEPIDLVSILGELRRNGTASSIESVASWLAELTTKIVTTINAAHHAKLILQSFFSRELIKTCEEYKLRAFGGEDIFALSAEAESSVANIGAIKQGGPVRASEEWPGTFEGLLRAGELKVFSGVRSGFDSIDKITHGWQPGEQVILAARPSQGKAQPYESKILTPDGWTTMGKISIDDFVLTPDGRSVKVRRISYQPLRQIYKVSFSDGRTVECCLEHLWRVRTKHWDWRVLTTQQIIAFSKSVRYSSGFEIQNINGHGWGNPNPCSIDPWVLGYLLGNGCLKGSTPRFSSADKECIDRMAASIPDAVFSHSGKYDYRISFRGSGAIGTNPIKKELRRLNLLVGSPDKFIPEEFFGSERTVRIELLRGLLDSDGWVSQGMIGFSSSSKRLSEGVVQLARSLGHNASLRLKTNVSYLKNGVKYPARDAFIVSIATTSEDDLFFLERKKKRVRKKRRGLKLKIVRIEESRVAPAKCIEIDSPDGLYITDEYTATHNSALLLQLALNAARRGHGVVFFSLEMKKRALMRRLVSMITGIDHDLLKSGIPKHDERWDLISDAGRQIEMLPIYFDDERGLNPLDIRARVARVKRKHNIELVCVDYLQKMNPGMKMESREREIAYISGSLFTLWGQMNVAGIVASQLNRNIEQSDRQPIMSDLRESGSLEQDADIIAFIHYPNRRDVSLDVEPVEIIFAKNRDGSTGMVQLEFKKNLTRFDIPELPQFESSEHPALSQTPEPISDLPF